jgi:hypothetical protein
MMSVIRKAKGKVYFQVMWKHLSKPLFPLSETGVYTYFDQICGYLEICGNVVEQVTGAIEKTP